MWPTGKLSSKESGERERERNGRSLCNDHISSHQ